MAKIFDHDEDGFLQWTCNNPNGFVANFKRHHDPNYVVLHKGCCHTMQRHRNIEWNPGGFTERDFLKACSTSVDDLDDYLAKKMRMKKPVFTKCCFFCRP